MKSDFLLIREMKQGQEQAYDLFVRKYYEEILNYCLHHCHDQKYAEDLTQETFIRFFSKLSSYQYKGKTKNYLYKIAGNLCKDFYKKVKEIPVEEESPCWRLDDGGKVVDGIIDKHILEKAIGQLQPELYEIIVLYYFQELKQKEIANILQIGLPLVKYRIRSAKRQLEEILKKENLQ